MNKISKLVLFVDDCNGFEGYNPRCNLVEIPAEITKEAMQKLELSQVGVMRRGGKWEEIMQDGQFAYIEHSHGRLSDFQEGEYDEKYNLISGNY
jgi:hypothetical protein